MKLPRLAIPVIAVLVIAVLAVATTTALVAARAQPPGPGPAATVPPAQANTPDTPTPEPAPTAGSDALPKPAPELADQSVLKPADKDFEPKPMSKTILDRGPKGNRVPPGPVQTESSQAVSRAREAAGKESIQGPVYTWQDGDRTMRAVLQEDLVVKDRSVTTPHQDTVVAGGGKNSIVRKQGKDGVEAEPVFRSESGGGLMTLPGGVMLALDPDWDQTAVDKFFAANDIPADRVTPLEFLDNGFFVETEPGFPALELANSLADQEGVAVSSPNWWREVKAK